MLNVPIEILCTHHINWGDVATWVAGIGTLLAFLRAFSQLEAERKYRRNKEIRFQAEHISAWIEDEKDTRAIVAILNRSNDPIYGIIVTIVQFSGTWTGDAHIPLNQDYTSFISIIPPGKFHTDLSSNYHGMMFHPAIEIAFTDKNGKSWIRKADGRCIEIEKRPIEHYDIHEPVGWNLPGKQV